MATVIVTTYNDRHAYAVCAALRVAGEECNMVFTSDFPAAEFHNVFLGNTPKVILRGVDGEIDLLGADTIWFRRCRSPKPNTDILHPDDVKFVQRSLSLYHRQFWYSVASLAPRENIFWVNDPVSATLAESKLLQLETARKVGFKVPDTLVSNDRDCICKFIRRARGPVVKKSFTPFVWMDDLRANGTTFVTEEDLPSAAVISTYPEIFQVAVPRSIEVRAFFAGNQYIALAFAPTAIVREMGPDWRNLHKFGSNASIPYQLDPVTHQHCIAMLSELKLVTGSFDLLVDDLGTVTFLEVNQSGQFLWMEAAGVPALDFFCQFLVGRSTEWEYQTSSEGLELSSVVSGPAYEKIDKGASAHIARPDDEYLLAKWLTEGE